MKRQNKNQKSYREATLFLKIQTKKFPLKKKKLKNQKT